MVELLQHLGRNRNTRVHDLEIARSVVHLYPLKISAGCFCSFSKVACIMIRGTWFSCSPAVARFIQHLLSQAMRPGNTVYSKTFALSPCI